MKVSVLITQKHRLLSLVAITEVFNTANTIFEAQGKSPFYNVQLVGLESDMLLPDGLDHYTYVALENAGDSDLVLVPAFKDYDMPANIQANVAFLPWMGQNLAKGGRLASCCTGSFLLAAGGFLNKGEATTHLEACNAMAQAFPDINVLPHAVVTKSRNVYTSGGATSSFHLLILLVQETCGREYALQVAKNFAIDMDRDSQLYFEHFKPIPTSEDKLVRDVQLLISTRFKEIKTVEEALDTIPSSRRNIVRRFKTATGMTPIRYLQKTKIEAAKSLLESTDKDVVDVMLSSGYNDIKSFRQLFKTFTGLTPRDYRDKFGMAINL